MTTFQKTYSLPFTTATVYAHWIANETVIAPAAAMQIEPRVGGSYRLIMPGGFSMNGVFSRVESGKALTYSWQWDGDTEETEVAVTFTPTPSGTDVQIRHGEFHSAASYDNHASGWDSYIAGFIEHVNARVSPD